MHTRGGKRGTVSAAHAVRGRGAVSAAPLLTPNELFAFLMYIVGYVCIHVSETLYRTNQNDHHLVAAAPR